MFKAGKIMWQDGMFIYPQHFQQQDAYYEGLLQKHSAMQSYHNWGILELVVDEAYLKLNKIMIRKCIGIFPDGTLFDVPERDDIPAVVEVPNNYNNRLVYLGITMGNRYGMKASNNERDIHIKYYSEEHEITDVNTQRDEKTITVCKLNLNLFLENEYKEQIIAIPILRVLDANNGIVIDPNYIPPCLRVKSSRVLQGYASQILGLLEQYINANSYLMGENMTDHNVGRIENALILQSVGSYRYLFELIANDSVTTPYILLQKVVSLIGSLIIFTRHRNLKAIKIAYEHTNLQNSFKDLMDLISKIFEVLHTYISSQVILNLEDESIYKADLSHASLDNLTLIMGIEFQDILSYQEHTKIFHSIKISSSDEIKRIVSLQVSGMVFSIVKVLPSYVSYNEKTLYLRLEQTGDFWHQIKEKKNIAVYLKNEKVENIKLWIIPN